MKIFPVKLKFFCKIIFLVAFHKIFFTPYTYSIAVDMPLSDTTVTTIKLDDVIVKASRLDTKLRSISGSVQVIHNEKFQQTELANLSVVLNSVPGVYMQSGSFQTSRLTIRGIGSRNPYGSGRIRAFYDEISLSSGDGTTIIEDIEPLFIEKAEIIKGPNSAWYGAGIGGSIRLFSPPGVEKTEIRIFSGVGTYGSYKVGGMILAPLTNGFVNIGIARAASDGYRQNSDFYRNSIFVSGSTGSNFRINYLVFASDVNARIPSSIDETTFHSNPRQAATNWLNVKGYKKYKRILGGIQFKKNLSQNITNSLNISGSYSDPYELRPFNILDENSMSFNINEKIEIKKIKYSFLIGGECLYEDYRWRVLQNQSLTEQQKAKEIRNQANVFSTFQTSVLFPFQMSIGVNLNWTRYNIYDLFHSDSIDYSGKTNGKYIISPRLGFSVPLNRNVTAYASIGNGFSNPTVEESLNSQGFLNINLKPEQGWGFDLGMRAYILKNCLWIDIAYYNIQLQDLLVTKRISEEVFSGENAGTASLQGFELFAQYQPLQRFRAMLSFQQSVNRFKNFKGEHDYSGNELPGIPVFTMNSEIQVNLFRRLFLYLNFSFYGRQYITDDNSKATDAWKTVDLKVSNIFKIRKSLIEIESGIKNMLNERYASMVLVNAPSLGPNPPRYYYPGLPVNYFFTLKFIF